MAIKFGFRPEPLPKNDTEHAAWAASSFDHMKVKLATYSGKTSDLRQYASPRHDQMQSSTCVAQSTVKALELKRIMKYGATAHKDLSRLALYYLARELMSPQETNVDQGTIISIAADCLQRFGVCEESLWSFTDDLKTICTPPSWLSMREAYLHKITKWYRITSTGTNRVEDVITALASGFPVVYGTSVGSAWESYDSQSFPLGPPTSQSDILGGHATVLEGWDGSNFWCENSWGMTWGHDGFYQLQPEVVSSDYSSDFVVIEAGWEDLKVAA